MKKVFIIILLTIMPNIVNGCSWNWANPLYYIIVCVFILQALFLAYSLFKIIKKLKKWSKWTTKKLILLITINLFTLFILNSIYQWINWLLLCS